MSIPQTPSPLANIIASKTYNAAWFSGPTKEQQITNAIAAAVADGALYVYIPANMTPYSASSVSFNNNVRMLVEGGDPTTYDIRAYGAAQDKLTDDGSAIQAAINAMGNVSTMGYGTLRITGPACIYGTILIDRKWIHIDMSNNGSLVWNGADNLTMLKFIRSWQVSGKNLRFLNRHSINKPKAAIEINFTTGDSPAPTRFDFEHVVISGDGFDPGTAGAFYSGLITSGNNVQCDQSSMTDFSISNCSAYGIQLLGSQNVFWAFRDGTINAGLSAVGIYTAARYTTLDSVFFQTNGTDIQVENDADVHCTDIGSEISGRFCLSTTAGSLYVDGGYWQYNSANQNADGKILNMQGGVSVILENFRFTNNGAQSLTQTLWLRGTDVLGRFVNVIRPAGVSWTSFLDVATTGASQHRRIEVEGLSEKNFTNEWTHGATFNTVDPLRYDLSPTQYLMQEDIQVPALQNSWANFGSGFSTWGCYKSRDGRVWLRGMITGGTTTDTTLIATLPSGYRPAQTTVVIGYVNSSATPQRYRIASDGTIKLDGTSAATIALDGISFRADGF